MTKALHPKRPALIPMLDSVVQAYLQDDDLGAQASFGERALALVRGYKRDLDRNSAAVRAVQAGDRDTRLQADRGANPRSADLVRPGRGLNGQFRPRPERVY